jgi:hypothetical protein
MMALKVNAENLHTKLFKNGAKVLSKSNFEYKDYSITIKFFDIKEAIFVEAKNNINNRNSFDEYFFYFTKDEIVKMVKERINNINN